MFSKITLSNLKGARRLDAELYNPENLKISENLKKIDCATIGTIASRCKKGIFDMKAETYSEKGVPFIRISNLGEGFINDDDDALGIKRHSNYLSKLSLTFSSNRLDAEFFQPVYDQLHKLVESNGAVTIGRIQEHNRRGVQPHYLDEGEVEVVTSKRLGKTSVDYENLERTTIDFWTDHRDAQVKPLDILTYTTGAYVGRTNCFLENKRTLASNHVNVLRVRRIDPMFLAVYLNSIIGQMQVQQAVSGSAQFELYPKDISEFVVWDAPQEVQEEVTLLVKQSHEARQKSKKLLSEARESITKEIERQFDAS